MNIAFQIALTFTGIAVVAFVIGFLLTLLESESDLHIGETVIGAFALTVLVSIVIAALSGVIGVWL